MIGNVLDARGRGSSRLAHEAKTSGRVDLPAENSKPRRSDPSGAFLFAGGENLRGGKVSSQDECGHFGTCQQIT